MSALATVPVYQDLHQIYGDLVSAARQAPRWDNLASSFAKRFGKKPTHIVRAPGRVNLIGEHIDYCLFGVLPAAVEPDILIAVGPSDRTDGSIIVDNEHDRYDEKQFVPERTDGTWTIPIDKKKLSWESYVKAGYLGVLNHFFTNDSRTPQSANMVVTGSVPAGSGLSSSAAMVVASSLAFMLMNDHFEDLTKRTLVELAMENERRVGVNSGGMDQAASVIPDSNSVLYITFYPHLDAETVAIPTSSNPSYNPTFLIANSLVVSDKAVNARTQYNLRVVETLAASRILSRSLGVNVGPKEKLQLRHVLDRWTGDEAAMRDPKKMQDALINILDKLDCLKSPSSAGGETGMTMEEMIDASGLSKSDFDELYLSWIEVEADRFQLYRRTKHVYADALRVLQFREVLQEFDGAESSIDLLQRLGDILNDGHTSCRDDLENSCDEVDDLVLVARAAGAYGSRVTGAGWGGCTVSLVAESNVPAFIEKVRSTYGRYKGLGEEELQAALFATKPGSGACVYKVTA